MRNRRRNWFIKRIALGFAVAAFVAPVAQAKVDEGIQGQLNTASENVKPIAYRRPSSADKLNPSELFALAMQAGVLKDKGKPFVMALTNGRMPSCSDRP